MWRPIKMVISLRLLSFLWPLLVSILASCLSQWSSNYNQLECIEIIFLCCWLLSKHIFGWLDISKTLRSCLNNFKWWRLLTDHDDVEGEEGATILVQLRVLLHRLTWASLMADDDVDDDDVEDILVQLRPLLHNRPGPLWWLRPDSRLHSQRQRAPPPPQFYSYSTLCQL